MALPRILLIEDNIWDIELVGFTLTKELGPHHLEVLRDGEEALEFIREHRRNPPATPDPCVILLDLRLPRHDGLRILEELREARVLTHIQVVVLSSFATPEEREQVQSLGGIFREKPAQLDDFEVLAGAIADFCRDGLRSDLTIAGVG